jgi:hypothetical protein
MAGRHTVLARAKFIIGTTILVLGTFILYQELASVIAWLSCTLANRSDRLGILPAVVLAASQPAHAYAVDHHRFLQNLFRPALSFMWPLLPVIFGSILLSDTLREQSKGMQQNNKQLRDLRPPCADVSERRL